MSRFARCTGLSDTSVRPRRYLWTDAFAVCNYLQLYRDTGDASFLKTARQLVAQVHFVLGRYSDNDPRSGWISGLDEEEGARHPTAGGLRIGKRLPERAPDQPMDERREWDRDGQYFHYLTRWMQALTRMAAQTGESCYQRWALELAAAAHRGFTYQPATGGSMAMHWKMSIDLSRPQVASMGAHDPLDALVSYRELRANGSRYGFDSIGVSLDREIAESERMCAHRSWVTDDPLGIGGLLVDTFRLAQMQVGVSASDSVQLTQLMADCELGLEAFVNTRQLEYPAEHRLAFRELGLATGLEALERLGKIVGPHHGNPELAAQYRKQLGRTGRFIYLAEEIENYWLQPANQAVLTWRDHPDINTVMLATTLAPDAYLSAGRT